MAKSILDLIPKQVIDQTALTSNEISDKRGCDRGTAGAHIRKLLKEGSIEKVWKREGGRLKPAYRLKSKS